MPDRRRSSTGSARSNGRRPRPASRRPWPTWPTSCSSSTRSARPLRATPSRPTTTSSASSKTPSTYNETDDQLTAIADIKRDMESTMPMDRLLCGDVGYGKTEVAMRAAFKAVQDGKQVAVLTPTTVLCFQHFETFKRRFARFPHQRRDDLALPHAEGAEGHPRKGRQPARSTSSSAPIACSRKTSSSRTSACSSSTKSSASASATKSA